MHGEQRHRPESELGKREQQVPRSPPERDSRENHNRHLMLPPDQGVIKEHRGYAMTISSLNTTREKRKRRTQLMDHLAEVVGITI
jgi:hypothetical protein